ncbi:hypothetical protein Y1Q_0016588 [Alligator mississippiensis]|uniref:Uncharacterized protein n=1 Tax=Alligator mississippiensis TaxID=8496 RepID=A0A151MJQ4_ALLMI|nr:hypothetical protein Y1Q_0016588 [Alligator mississippiensis]
MFLNDAVAVSASDGAEPHKEHMGLALYPAAEVGRESCLVYGKPKEYSRCIGARRDPLLSRKGSPKEQVTAKHQFAGELKG